MSLVLEPSLTRQDSVMFDIIKGSRCGSCPTGRSDLLSGSSGTFVLRHNYCHFSDTSSFLQRFFSLEAAAAGAASLQGASLCPPPIPSFASLLSSVLLAEISRLDKSQSLQGGVSAAVLGCKWRSWRRRGGGGRRRWTSSTVTSEGETLEAEEKQTQQLCVCVPEHFPPQCL